MGTEKAADVPLIGPVRLNAENFGEVARGLPSKARMVLAAGMNLARGTLNVRMPDGRSVIMGGNAPGPQAQIILNNWNLPGRAFAGGTIGVAESYIDGDWESPDVTSVLELFVVNTEAGERLAGGASWVLTTIQRMRHWLNENTRRGSMRNISAHYDLGNQFYRQWLELDDDLFVGVVLGWRQRSRKCSDREVQSTGPRCWHWLKRSRPGDWLRLGRFCRIRGARGRMPGDRTYH